jgi:hypothetical protein
VAVSARHFAIALPLSHAAFCLSICSVCLPTNRQAQARALTARSPSIRARRHSASRTYVVSMPPSKRKVAGKSTGEQAAHVIQARAAAAAAAGAPAVAAAADAAANGLTAATGPAVAATTATTASSAASAASAAGTTGSQGGDVPTAAIAAATAAAGCSAASAAAASALFPAATFGAAGSASQGVPRSKARKCYVRKRAPCARARARRAHTRATVTCARMGMVAGVGPQRRPAAPVPVMAATCIPQLLARE